MPEGKILIAEDEPVSRRLLEAYLVKLGYSVVVTCDGNEAWKALQTENAPRLAILDWMMPGLDGVEICRKLRREPVEPYTYIILLTALQRDEDLVVGMDAGADDYITKPFKANELRVRLRAGMRIVELQNELIGRRDALKDQASHDPLTGLWNRREILAILVKQLSRVRREGGCLSVIMADLDHFKKVNDTYGHMAGDVVLRQTARRMLSLVRDYDYVGRYGGEEFLLVLPGCDRDSALTFAERLRQRIGGEGMAIPEGRVSVTISLGVASADAASAGYVDPLVRAADQALYRAKRDGRNRVEMVS